MDGWYPGGRMFKAPSGAKMTVVWLPIWQQTVFTKSCFDSRQQYTKIGDNYKLPFLWRIARSPDVQKRSAVFLRFVSCSLWLPLCLYSVFSHATSYQASQKMHIHTGDTALYSIAQLDDLCHLYLDFCFDHLVGNGNPIQAYVTEVSE